MTLPVDAVDGGTYLVRALHEYGRCASSVTPLGDAVDGGTLTVRALYEYGKWASSVTPLTDAVVQSCHVNAPGGGTFL